MFNAQCSMLNFQPRLFSVISLTKTSSMILLIITFILFTTGIIYAQQPVMVSFKSNDQKQLLDGRLILMLAKTNQQEPRFQVTDDPETQIAFGIDVENW